MTRNARKVWINKKLQKIKTAIDTHTFHHFPNWGWECNFQCETSDISLYISDV